MKAILVSILLLACAAHASDIEERAKAFASALAAFDSAGTSEQFREAAAKFELLRSPSYQDDALNYNIGNAHLKAAESDKAKGFPTTDYGRAILAYRKAQLFRPRDKSLNSNLKQALNAAPGHLAEPPARLWRNVIFWSGWLSYPEKFHAALVIWFAGILAFSVGTIWPHIRKSARLHWIGGVLVALAVLLSIDADIAYTEVYYSSRAAVVERTEAKTSPSPNGDPAFDKPLEDGAEFTVIERRGDWVLAQFPGSRDAWLPAKNIAE